MVYIPIDSALSCDYNVITMGGTYSMKSRIIKIGNSRGIRLPKPLIEQAGLKEEVEIQVEGNRLIIASVTRPRAHWSDSFKKMASKGDDALLDGDVQVPTTWDEDEWEWE
jgi:antitoxin MazE